MTQAELAGSWLSQDPRKLEYYNDDSYFWEGLATLEAVAADRGSPAESELRHLTFMLVKPEAIVGRRVAPILDFLSGCGFRIAGTWPLRMGRHEVRCVWRYQFNAIPIAHIRAHEMMLAEDEVFLVGLDHRLTDGQPSAARLLARSKGSSADPGGGNSLRDLLGRPALLIAFVHAPDEPADVVRELAVLCEWRLQREIFATLLAARQWPDARFAAAARAARALMTSRYDKVAAHDLDATAALSRLRARLAGDPMGLSPAALAAIRAGHTAPDRALGIVAELENATELPRWDRIVTAIQLVDRLRTGSDPLIGPPPSPFWERLGAADERE
ncbi:MAG TPA: hypothetical protein VFQ44_15145 [Streptosporangiaceae bacterium]|nr:hypothetical protein [Streptosporangiaceae bacterium]